MTLDAVDSTLLDRLACPRQDHSPLFCIGDQLRCEQGHEYPVIDRIPVLLVNEAAPTHRVALESLQRATCPTNSSTLDATPPSEVHPLVQALIADTCGYLYKSAIGRLTAYPVPDFPLQPVHSEFLIDVGCHWGRWSLAASKRGFDVIGLDPSLEAITAARTIAKQLNLSVRYVVGDARYLPFRSESVDVLFSYGVFQHLSKHNVKIALAEAGRVLASTGYSYIQMPNKFGVRQAYHQVKRALRAKLYPDPTPYTGAWNRCDTQSGQQLITESFEVRYWTPRELLEAFATIIGPTELSADGYFGLGVGSATTDGLSPGYRAIVAASNRLRSLSTRVPRLASLADSVYLRSAKD